MSLQATYPKICTQEDRDARLFPIGALPQITVCSYISITTTTTIGHTVSGSFYALSLSIGSGSSLFGIKVLACSFWKTRPSTFNDWLRSGLLPPLLVSTSSSSSYSTWKPGTQVLFPKHVHVTCPRRVAFLQALIKKKGTKPFPSILFPHGKQRTFETRTRSKPKQTLPTWLNPKRHRRQQFRLAFDSNLEKTYTIFFL